MTNLLKKIFALPYANMEKRWWHRLLKVIFIISIVLFFLVALLVTDMVLSENPKTYYTQKITLNEFARQYMSGGINDINRLDEFKQLKGQLGCTDGREIRYLWNLEGYCSPYLRNNMYSIMAYARKNGATGTDDALRSAILNNMDVKDDTGLNRVCFISSKANCTSSNIVKYKFNLIFYFLVGIYSTIASSIYFAVIYLLYVRGILYIVYGKANR